VKRWRVRRHVRVEDDILDLAAYIAKDSRPSAFRFLGAVEQTITDLRYMPGKGSPKTLRARELAGIRSWAVRGFPNHLILYELRSDGVFVLAIVQGSRRYATLLRKRLNEE
jgi:toxin ParE1/3/4